MHESHDKDNWLSWCGGFEGRGELLPMLRCVVYKWGRPLVSTKYAAADAVATNISGCEIISSENITK